MKIVTLFVGALLLAGSLGTSTAFGAAPGVTSNQVITEGSYCHLTSLRFVRRPYLGIVLFLRIPVRATSSTSTDRVTQTRLGKIKSNSRGLERQHRWQRNYSD